MHHQIELENIEEMRRQQGIDDVELADEIRRLSVGDVVILTFLSDARAFETVPIRITRISGVAFRGKLVRPSACFGRGKLVEFTIAHIHSVVSAARNHASRSSVG